MEVSSRPASELMLADLDHLAPKSWFQAIQIFLHMKLGHLEIESVKLGCAQGVSTWHILDTRNARAEALKDVGMGICPAVLEALAAEPA